MDKHVRIKGWYPKILPDTFTFNLLSTGDVEK